MYNIKTRVNKLYRLLKQKIGEIREVKFFCENDDGLVDATSKQPAELSQAEGNLNIVFSVITPERHAEIRENLKQGILP